MEKPISMRGLILTIAVITAVIVVLIRLYQAGDITVSFPATIRPLRNFSIRDYSYFQGEYSILIIATKEVYVEKIKANEDNLEINQIKKPGEQMRVFGKTLGKEINLVVYYREDDFAHSTYTSLPERP